MKKTYLQFGIAFLLTLFVSSAGGNIFGQDCLPSMIGYWNLGEGSGPIYADSSGAARDAIAIGTPSQIAGISGRAQEFSLSSSTYLTISDDPVFDWTALQSFSIELWVKYTRTTGNVMVFAARNDTPSSLTQWWIGSDAGKITFYFRGSNGPSGYVASPFTYADGNWHQVVAVRDGSLNRMYLYVDGIVQNASGYPFSSFGNLASNNPITIGNMLTNTVPEFFSDAGIDEVAIFSEALNASTILEHYNNVKNFSINYCSGDNPVFLTQPVNTATVNQLYTYDVDASGNSKPEYELISSPPGMVIDETTGVIGWTPTSQGQNGAVTVRASNNKGSADQNFNIFLADVPMCTPGLYHYWDFDLVGTAGWVDKKDASYEFSGLGPVTVPGIAGNAVMFDGSNDSLNLHDNRAPANSFFDFKSGGIAANFTIEFWMNSTQSFGGGNPKVILGRDEPDNSSQYWIGVYSDGDVGVFLRDWVYPVENAHIADLRGEVNLLDGNWHHVALTYNNNGGHVLLYVDKDVVAEQHGVTFLDFGGGEPLNIGHLNIGGSADFWYEGLLDELAFYNTPLDQATINSNYSNTLGGNNHCVYNYAPVILSRPDSTVLQENLYVYNIEASDFNVGDPITISKVSAPAWLNSFSFTPGFKTAVLSGTPSNADVGTHTVIIRVSDGYVNVDQTFSVRVMNANDPPVFSFVASTSIPQNDTYTATVFALDPDEDALTYSAPQTPEWLDFDPVTRVLTGVPDNDAVGPNSVTIRVNDGTIDLDTSFIITVTNVNDPPEFTSSAITQIDQNALYSYKAEADDPDGDVLTYTAVQKPSWLDFNPSTQVLSGTAGGDDVGFHNVTLRVADAVEEVDQVFQIEVLDVNDPPQFSTTPPLTVDQNATFTYTVLATDPEGDPVTYSAPQIPSWLLFNPSTRILSGIPGNMDVGIHPITLRAKDDKGAENDQPFTLTVNNVNDLPEITSTPVDWARVGMTYLYSITVSDPDPGDVLTFTAESMPAWLNLTSASTTAILNGTPTSGDKGTHAIIIKVSDGTGDAVQGFSITVTDPNSIGDVEQLVSNVYPNPTDSEVHFDLVEYGDAWLKIMDTKGAVLMEVRAENTDKFSVDLSELPSDIYFYSITINEKTTFGKLVRE